MYLDPTDNIPFTLDEDFGWSLNQPDMWLWCEIIFCGPHPLHAQTAGSLSKVKMKKNSLWCSVYKDILFE